MSTDTTGHQEETLPAKAARNSLTTLSSAAGGIVFQTVAEARDVAYLMAGSDLAVRKHLRNNPGACFGIVIQAVEWGMSPYAVANKSYAVNDQLAYESQRLIQAVILRRAPIQDQVIHYEYEGDGDKRRCLAWATTLSGVRVEYKSPEISKITPKNSPLWKSDPDLQFSYYSGRALCRKHFPHVLLGVYDVDELEGSMKTVGQQQTQPSGFADRLAGTTGGKGFNPKTVDAEINGEATTEPDPEIVRAGATAFVDGEPREIPDDLELKTEAQRRDWFQGYDEAERASQGGDS